MQALAKSESEIRAREARVAGNFLFIKGRYIRSLKIPARGLIFWPVLPETFIRSAVNAGKGEPNAEPA